MGKKVFLSLIKALAGKLLGRLYMILEAVRLDRYFEGLCLYTYYSLCGGVISIILLVSVFFSVGTFGCFVVYLFAYQVFKEKVLN